ncbi:MAG: hypothetical protein KF708_15110 [Pirellulales bacterium]|nr:hypothetical protein [Pirellulales bacterium]
MSAVAVAADPAPLTHVASVLPLPTTAFERYMLTDDRASHPMTFTIRLRFSGLVDRKVLDGAIDRGVRRHPLLCANLAHDEQGQLNWIAAHDPRPYVDYGDATTPLHFPGTERIDLRTNTGLRIWIRSGDGHTEMRFQFHHSCCDGIGAYAVVEDVLCAYHLATCPDDCESGFHDTRPERLRGRTNFGLTWWRLVWRLPQEIWGAVAGLILFLIIRPQPLVAPEEPTETPGDSPPLLDYPAHTFDVEESNQLRDVARAAHATMNDLLMRDLFVAMHDWNARLAPETEGALLRVMVPMNLRLPADSTMPAANIVAMVNIDRWYRMYRNPALLLRSIVWEMRFLQYFRFALAFIRCITFLERIPGGLNFLTRANRCYATSVLSNMGRVLFHAKLPWVDGKLRAGGLLLEGVASAPPVRPHVATSLTCLFYGGRLTLVQNYDRRHFTPEAASQLLAATVQQLQATAATAVRVPDAAVV